MDRCLMVFAGASAQFSEAELVELTMAVIAINGWNRINVAFRTVPGTYRRPGTRTTSGDAVTDEPAAG